MKNLKEASDLLRKRGNVRENSTEITSGEYLSKPSNFFAYIDIGAFLRRRS